MVATFHSLVDGDRDLQGWPCRMHVCGQSEARRFQADLAATHVLSVVTPGRSYLGPRDVAPDHHLKVEFDDVEDAGRAGAPSLELVRSIGEWTATLPDDARLCLHGLQGVRRAPAVALGILAARVPPADAVAALARFCRHAPDPNLLVVRLFDEALGLGGALLAACQTRFAGCGSALRRRDQSEGQDFNFDMLALDGERARGG
ncbi:phosphatase [Jiella avicenniae]|uniref:Phosphatase n=1 Tax=Jiella avicenniae TaxID=2907202 RepID=A0A9X1NYT6_9HYPH|nr:phosphatase [Jiella avicenniae]MCE7026774.1 phosphatase [Jiella avicenniae]